MATKKETKEKKSTIKEPSTRKTTLKKDLDDFDFSKVKEITKEELVETPIPDPVDVIMDEKGEIKEVEPIPEAKPEKLGTVVIDEGIERAECEKKDLEVLTTADLKPPKRGKANKAHDPANDVIITTHDFKPRTWGESKKL